jgi:hypothetical protein
LATDDDCSFLLGYLPMTHATDSLHLPDALPILRARITMRLLEDAILPRFKGAMLRGGFGYAFQRASCPPACWNTSHTCTITPVCPYRWIFETPHPPDIAHLHNLRDVPRPFVIEPPLENRTHYAAGDSLEWHLVLIGRGKDYLPYFLFAFEQLGRMGLGKAHARAHLERVEALQPWQPTSVVVYQDGRVQPGAEHLPYLDTAMIITQAQRLPADVRVSFPTPLRLKTRGAWMERLEPTALVQAICWRLHALAVFHGNGPWDEVYPTLVAQAGEITVEDEQVQWVDWGRTSRRGGKPQYMVLGGLIGSVVLRGVSPGVRAVLLTGSLVHVGKACVFGHGNIQIAAKNPAPKWEEM